MNNGFQNVKLIYMNLDSFFCQSFKEITLKTNLVQLILKSQSGQYLCQAKNSCIMLTCIPPAFMNDSLCSLITWLLHSIYHSRHPSTLPSFLESLSFLRFKFTVLLQLFNYPFSSLLGISFLPPAPSRFLAPCPSLLVWFSGEQCESPQNQFDLYMCFMCSSKHCKFKHQNS